MDFKVAGTRRVRHRPAARHQDRRHPRRRAGPAPCSRPRRPASQILEVMAGAIAEPRDEVGRHGPEDHQLRDPDRQDRRGHRAQGQGHQRHPGRDRRRHHRRRRRHGRHRVASARPTAAPWPRPSARSELILNPPDGRGRRDLPRARSSTSPSSVRSSTSSRAVTAWSTSPSSVAASASTGSRTSSYLGDEIEVRVDDVDPNGKVSLTPLGEHGGGDDDGEAPAPRESRDRGDRDRGESRRPWRRPWRRP